MQVIQVFNRYLERGGEEKSVERIASHIENLGHQLDRVWISSEEWLGEGGPSKVEQIRRMFANSEFESRLAERIDGQQVDCFVTHNLYPVASPSVYRFAQENEFPLIQFVHNFRPFSVGGSLWVGGKVVSDGLKGNHLAEVLSGSWQDSVLKSAVMGAVLWNLQRKEWLEAVTCWVAISDFMREKFIEAGIPGEKIVTLRHSWDPRLMENQEGEGDYYLFLSRLVPEKGTQSLLNAWNLLEDEMGGACPKLLIGGTGSDENLVRKASENSDKIEFLGFVSGDEKSKLIEKCRAMLAPSVWWEPLGLVTYEAYDNGRPMIAARSGGLSETIEDGVTGFLHEVGSADSLMRCVLQMEERGASARREMGIAGREWLLREASPEKWKSEFQKILLGVSSDK